MSTMTSRFTKMALRIGPLSRPGVHSAPRTRNGLRRTNFGRAIHLRRVRRSKSRRSMDQ